MRTRLFSVPRRFALAALMVVSALGGARADDADPPAGVAGRGNADGSVAVQPAAALRPIATPPKTNNGSRARSDPAPRTQSTNLRRRTHKAKPSPADRHLPPTPRRVAEPGPAARSESSAALPPVAHGTEPVVTQTQAKDPDPRDAAAHADRTSRDRAER
jgi:hypothetical protein